MRRPLRAVAVLALFALPLTTATSRTTEEGAFAAVLVPRQRAALALADEGVVAEVLVERGQRVVEGQLLARLDVGVERAELDLSRTRIAAPFDALVTGELVDRGQVVAPGTPLIELVAVEAFEVRLPLVERERALLGPLGVGDVEGPPVDLTVAGRVGPGRWSGRIVRTLPALDATSRALVAIARVDDPLGGDVPLRLGEFVRATLPGRRLEGAVTLPEAALRDGSEVWIADGQDRLERRPVAVAQRLEGQVVGERGLAGGERVIVSALEAAPVGLPLEVAERGR